MQINASPCEKLERNATTYPVSQFNRVNDLREKRIQLIAFPSLLAEQAERRKKKRRKWKAEVTHTDHRGVYFRIAALPTTIDVFAAGYG